MKRLRYLPLLIIALVSLVSGVLPWGQPATVYAATIANDTFTDADRTKLESHTADDGSTWTVNASNAQIKGNVLEGKTTWDFGRNSDDMGQDDVSAQADSQTKISGAGKGAGVMVRMHNTNTPGNDGFAGYIEGTATVARLVISKWVGGVETVLASTTDSHSIATFYTLRLEATNSGSDTYLELFEGGNSVLTYTESTDPMQGVNYRRAGLIIGSNKGLIDNWQSDTIFPPDISNTPSSWGFGNVDTNSTYATGINYVLDTSGFRLTNNSAFTVNITISAGSMEGGVAWPLADDGVPTATDYALKAGTQYTGGSYSITVTSSGVSLRDGVTAGSTLDWGLQFLTPTSFSDGASKSGNVTLTATQA